MAEYFNASQLPRNKKKSSKSPARLQLKSISTNHEEHILYHRSIKRQGARPLLQRARKKSPFFF